MESGSAGPATRERGAGTGGASPDSGRPRLGVLATHVIQYQAPLYQELSRRGLVDLEVAFLSDIGARSFHDPAFGVPVAWDTDVLGGYRWLLLAPGSRG